MFSRVKFAGEYDGAIEKVIQFLIKELRSQNHRGYCETKVLFDCYRMHTHYH